MGQESVKVKSLTSYEWKDKTLPAIEAKAWLNPIWSTPQRPRER